jgi:transcriptional regulator with XRE-family HTH domain
MSHANTPSVRFRRIGRTLRTLREERGMTLDTAGRRMERSAASLSTIETGQLAIRARDLAQILDFYGIRDGVERESLLHLARQGRKKDWPRSYEGRVSAAALDWASLESDSAVIRSFHPSLVPGLLQIEEYIRAVVSVGPDSKTRDNAQLVAFRISRQQILERPNPPRLLAVVAEAALRQHIGGPKVLRAQLRHLLDATARDHIALRVLPFAADVHPGINGAFDIFTLRPPGRLTVAVVEDLTQVSFREREEEVAAYEQAFEAIVAIALDEGRSRELIKRIVSEL